MLKAGLVERRSDPDDARCNRIRLKPKGRQVHAKLQPIASRLQDDLLTSIPLADRDQFLTHLASVADNLERLAEQESSKSTEAL
jgi:DNA-binding MarR family transcriptional regulator